MIRKLKFLYDIGLIIFFLFKEFGKLLFWEDRFIFIYIQRIFWVEQYDVVSVWDDLFCFIIENIIMIIFGVGEDLLFLVEIRIYFFLWEKKYYKLQLGKI